MTSPQVPNACVLDAHEVARQRAVDRLGVVGQPTDPAVADLVWLAAFTCDVPIALVGLMDHDRQWFAAECGLGASETPRGLTFCQHTLRGDGLMEVEDASCDPRFAAHPFVHEGPHVRFYAGVPLIGRSGHAYGTLCVVDTRPRRLTDRQREALTRLACQAVRLLEMRQSRNETEQARVALGAILESMPDGVVACDAQGVLQQFNGVARDWHGTEPRDDAGEDWATRFDLFAPDGARHLLTDEIPLARALRGEVVQDAEVLIRAKGREPRTVLCNARQVNTPDGEALGAVCVMRDVTALRRAEAGLQESETRLRNVLQHSHDAFVAADELGRVQEWNPAAEALFGWSRAEARGQVLGDLIVPPALRAAHAAGMARYLDTGEARVLDRRLQLRACHRHGHEFPVELTISRIPADGANLFTAFLHDISGRVETETRLRENEARLRAITDNAPALIAYLDPQTRYRFTNKAFDEWFGIAPGAAIGKTIREFRGRAVAEFMDPYLRRVLGGERVEMECDVPHVRLGLRHCHVTLIPDIEPERGVRGYHVMAFDVTAQKRLNQVLAEQALRDELTGLPNRAAWNEEFVRGLARASRLGAPVAVMFVDLDGFKRINDTYGHAAGDLVLKTFAQQLRGSLRASDLVARLAGDEFVVLLDRVTDVEGDPPRVAAKIIAAAAAGVEFNGHRLPIQPSIGIGIQRGPDFDSDALMQCADRAMYAAKRGPVGRVRLQECDAADV